MAMANTHSILADLVSRCKCKPGWSFALETPEGDVFPKLVITVPGYDSAGASSTDAVLRMSRQVQVESERQYQLNQVYAVTPRLVDALDDLRSAWGAHRRFTVRHFRPVPEAEYNEATWKRWLFDQCRLVENHEMGEWFRIDGVQAFPPLHGPGEDPYTVHEIRPLEDALTTQDGSKREMYR